VVDYEFVRLAFDELDGPRSGQGSVAYSTIELTRSGIRLGKGESDSPALIFPSVSTGTPDDLYLANMRVRHAVSLRLSPGGAIGAFSVMECTSSDPSIIDWFLRFAPEILFIFENGWSADGLNSEILRLSELFKLILLSQTRELAGLWAELLLIVRSNDPGLLVRAWHAAPTASKDFTLDGKHVEVKSTRGGERVHRFSVDQLQASGSVLVASVMLTASDSGPSVLDLFEALRSALAGRAAALEKLNRQVLSIVGLRIGEAEATRFDEQAAVDSVRVILGSDLPQLSPPFPAGVSRVQFWSNLGSCNEPEVRVVNGAALWRAVASVRR
jgi:hypothetical protein